MERIYQHFPLSAGRKIRVLLLQPSPEFDAPIQCSLREISLDTPQPYPYEALSYVWGATYGDQEIFCDDETLMVTSNCMIALRYLRLMTRERALWIDSVCIDMHSYSERNQQIKLMGDIYKLAQRVLIWLGEGDHETTKLIRKLRVHGSLLSFMYRGKVPSTFSLRPLDMKASMRQTFITLLEHDWFKRSWTLQELSLARHPVILCGMIGLEWKLFVFCVRYWAPSFSRHVWRAIHSIRSRELYQLWREETQEQRKRIDAHRPKGSSGRDSFNADLKRRRDQSTNLTNINSVAFLQLSRFRLATDPRDKIYSLYHMMTDMGVKLKDPDYQMPAQLLYEEVTFALIQSSRSLWILENLDSDNRMFGLPSWVPDFSQESTPNELLSDYEHFFDGYSPSTSPGHLILDGKVIHVVKMVAERMQLPNPTDSIDLNVDLVVQHLARWCSMALQPKGDGTAEDAMKNLSANLIHPNFEDESTAGRRQSIMDAGFDGFLLALRLCYDGKNGLGANGETHARHHTPDQEFSKCWKTNLPADSKRLVDEMITGSLGHRLFITSNGSFGLCKTDLQPEDLVVLFPGTTAPMILRGVNVDKFEIIGRASIYGIPKGAWPHRAGDYGLETFTLV